MGATIERLPSLGIAGLGATDEPACDGVLAHLHELYDPERRNVTNEFECDGRASGRMK